MNLVQKILNEQGFDALIEQCKELNVKVREDSLESGDTLYTLNYDQIHSPKSHELVMACRGIAIDKEKVVAHVLERFFNAGEMQDEQFDWSSFDAHEKADGSLIKLYCYKGEWHVATRGTAAAMVEGMGGEWVFREQALRVMGYSGEDEFQREAGMCFDPDYTYIMELCGAFNRIVTPYENDEMVLLTILDKNGEELMDHDIKSELQCIKRQQLNIRLAKRWLNVTKDELYKMVANLKDLQEGFVVRDFYGRRLKVKSDLYVKAHRIRGEGVLTLKRAAELVLDNEQDEYLAYFPDDRLKIESVIRAKNELLDSYSDLLAELVVLGLDRKEFALRAQKYEYSFLLFGHFNGQSVEESFERAFRSKQVEILVNEVKEDKRS